MHRARRRHDQRLKHLRSRVPQSRTSVSTNKRISTRNCAVFGGSRKSRAHRQGRIGHAPAALKSHSCAGTTNAPISATARNVNWKLASKTCSGSRTMNSMRHRRQDVQYSPVAVEEAADSVKGHARSRSQNGRVASGDSRIEPCGKNGEPDCNAARHRADPQEKQQRARQNGHMSAGYYQRMECAGRAIILRPHFVQFTVAPIRIACIMPLV